VGHDAQDGDAEALVVGDGGLEESHGTPCALGLHDLAEGHARGVVNADMDILPADATTVALPLTVAGDAVAYLIELAELFDVDVDHLAGLLALVSTGWLGRFQGAQLAQPPALEHAAHRGRRDADSGGDLVPGDGLGTEAFDALDHLWWRRLTQPVRPRAAVLQARQAFLLEAITPFAAGARANACGFTGGLRRLPTDNHFGQPLSTERC